MEKMPKKMKTALLEVIEKYRNPFDQNGKFKYDYCCRSACPLCKACNFNCFKCIQSITENNGRGCVIDSTYSNVEREFVNTNKWISVDKKETAARRKRIEKVFIARAEFLENKYLKG